MKSIVLFSITLFCLIAFLLVWYFTLNFKVGNHEKRSEADSVNFVDYKNKFFPNGLSPAKNSIICFFTQKDCPSCVYDVKNYSDISNLDIKFYTNYGNKGIANVKMRISDIMVVNVDSIFLKLQFPVVIVTDMNGKIIKWLKIDYYSPKETRDYIFSLGKRNK